MTETGIIRGFKVFNPDWTCEGTQYTCPGVFKDNSLPSVYHPGMKFYKQAIDCFWYNGFREDSFNPKNKVAEVTAYADRIIETKHCYFTKHLEIVREISWAELLKIVNTGEYCTGIYNSGEYNSGDRNCGDYNSGNCNSGNYNSGNCNSGNYNSGFWNCGNHNSGNRNSGDWNKCDFSNGCFNTVEPKIYLFNKPSEWTYKDWLFSAACSILKQIPQNVLRYERFECMTDEEKAAHPEAEVTGYCLKQTDDSQNVNYWWHEVLSDKEKSIIKAIPNFDKEIFKEITGIDVDMELE